MHIYLLVELHDSKNTALQDANASISELNSTQVDAKDIDIVMTMYILIE